MYHFTVSVIYLHVIKILLIMIRLLNLKVKEKQFNILSGGIYVRSNQTNYLSLVHISNNYNISSYNWYIIYIAEA